MSDRPHPGSDEAIAKGCICAVADNNYGRYAPRPRDANRGDWWIAEGCVVHDPVRSPDA